MDMITDGPIDVTFKPPKKPTVAWHAGICASEIADLSQVPLYQGGPDRRVREGDDSGCQIWFWRPSSYEDLNHTRKHRATISITMVKY